MTTEIGLSEVDAMFGQRTSTGRVGMPLFNGTSFCFELPPREELSVHGNLPQRSKYCLNQSAKTLLNDFFELNHPIVLDHGHTTTSLSAEQIIQFARAVGLELTLASYGLL